MSMSQCLQRVTDVTLTIHAQPMTPRTQHQAYTSELGRKDDDVTQLSLQTARAAHSGVQRLQAATTNSNAKRRRAIAGKQLRSGRRRETIFALLPVDGVVTRHT